MYKDTHTCIHPLLLYHIEQCHCRRRQWHPTPELLPGKSHGWRSLVGCRPWGRTELDTAERLGSSSSSVVITKIPGAQSLQSLLPCDTWWPLIFLLFLVLPFPECHVVGINSISRFQVSFFHLAVCS